MNERVYNHGADNLRSPERLEKLEVERVVDLCLNSNKIRSVLDIGTGSGLFAEAFHKRDVKVAGVDINQEMIKIARKFIPSGEFRVSPAEKLPFEDKTFDAVFLGLVFHEVNDYKKALEEAKRVARSEIFILEWVHKTEDYGPPLEHRLRKDFVKGLAEDIELDSFQSILLKNLVLYKMIVNDKREDNR